MAAMFTNSNSIVFTWIMMTSFLQTSYPRRIGQGILLCAFSQQTVFSESELHLCSHATIYNFIEVLCDRGEGIEFCDPSGDDKGFYKTLQKLKAHFTSNLGLRFAVGGIGETFITTRVQRVKFAKLLIDFMTQHGLSFVEFADSDLADSENKDEIKNFKVLMEELATLLHRKDFFVGMSTSDPVTSLESKYPLNIFEYLDWFTFNLPIVHRVDSSRDANFMTPCAPIRETEYENRTLKHWIELWLKRVKPEDLVLGMTDAGLRYTAKDSGVEPGPGSRAKGLPELIAFSEICRKLHFDNCQKYWNEESMSSWAACGYDYYTYDDERSLKLKVNIAKSHNLTGLAFLQRDFKYSCGDEGDPYTYLRAMQAIRNVSTLI